MIGAFQLGCVGVVQILWAVVQTALAGAPHRAYVTKNIVKGVCLSLLSPFSFSAGYEVVVRGAWDADMFRVCGCLYAAHDINGLLFMWPKLPATTRAHHLSVAAVAMASMYTIDYKDTESLWRGVGMLGVLSSLTGPVNVWLGLRHLGEWPVLRWTAARGYAACMAVSFAWQLMHVLRLIGVASLYSLLPYCMLLSIIFYDDWVLYRFMARS